MGTYPPLVPGIGSLNEKPLHAALKEWYRRDGDLVEHPVDGHVADLIRNGTLIEIQTRSFSAMRRKLDRLLDAHPVHLVHPVAATTWIVKGDEAGTIISRRRSPKRRTIADVCAELVSFPTLLSHPHFTLEVVLVEAEEVWRPEVGKGWRRKGFVITERRLVEVLDSTVFAAPEDLLGLVPGDLPEPFTTADLAAALGITRRLAQQVAYCLRESGVAAEVGRDRAGARYRRVR